MSETFALELEDVSAGYGETVVLEKVRLALNDGETRLGHRPQRRRQDHAGGDHHGPHHAARRASAPARQEIGRLSTYRRALAGLGYVPQEREIFPSLTLRENLEVAARPGRWTIEEVFELFPKLAARQSNRGNQLSGGEQQMLAIGRALIGNPSVLLMDEPSEGLAPVIVEELVRAVKQLAQSDGLTLCWSSRTPGSRSTSRRAPWSWTAAASSMTGRARRCSSDAAKLDQLIGLAKL